MENAPQAVLVYVRSDGSTPFDVWLAGLRDVKARATIRARMDRFETGIFGDCKPVGKGVSEMRIDVGPGYRVYFGRHGQKVVILLCAGDKSSQRKDIIKALEFWTDYRRREMPKTFKPAKPYHDSLITALKDRREAAEYLNAAMQDDDPRVFLMALRNVAEASGMSKVSRRAKLNRESLYKMLSKKGNPEVRSLSALLNALGMELQVKAKAS